MKEEIKNIYTVVGVVRETHDVSTLQLILSKKTVLPYIAGQFITIYFPELGTPEGKAYSISSAPHESTLNITVKAMGEFSRRLVAMRSGETITASLPYGFFYSESEKSNLCMLAGGIGIAPFRSMIVNSIKKHPLRTITLLYSVQNRQEIIFEKELNALQSEHSNFRIKYFITREVDNNNVRQKESNSMIFRRMSADDALETLSEENTETEFMLCGSIEFVRDMWRGLRAHNISEIAIYTEAFFSH